MEWLGKWKARTLVDLFDIAVKNYPDKEALIYKDRHLTYGDLGKKVDSIAKGLLHLGIKRNDKVAIWLSNSPEWIMFEFAVLKVGAVIVPLNTRLKAYDLRYILKQSDTTTLVMMDKFLKNDYTKIIQEILPDLPLNEAGKIDSKDLPCLKNIICLSEKKYPGMFSVNGIIAQTYNMDLKNELSERRISLSPEDVVNIPYTSGTTGFPKGVLTTNLQYIGEILVFKERLGIKEGDIFLSIAPFFANFGNYFGILLPTMVGGCTVILESFDPEECLRLIEKERCTHFTGTPTMYLDIFNHPNFCKYNIRSLRTAMTGASSASLKMINDVNNKMGVEKICNGYGMTENSGATTMNYFSDPLEVKANTTGKPFPDVEIKIVKPGTGEPLPLGEIGELCTRGWIVMKGYYKMPEATRKCFDSEGWFHTTDLGYLDKDGNFCITGRLKEMFISGGTNVYPNEIENFLYTHPKIKQVAVIGVPDERMGEVGFAFIVLKEGEEVTEDEMRNYCRERVSNYKVPKYVKFVKDIPMAGVGKVKKFELEELAKSELAEKTKVAS